MTTPEQRAREMLASVMNKPLVAEHVARGGPGTPIIKVSVAEAIRGMIAFANAELERAAEAIEVHPTPFVFDPELGAAEAMQGTAAEIVRNLKHSGQADTVGFICNTSD